MVTFVPKVSFGSLLAMFLACSACVWGGSSSHSGDGVRLANAKAKVPVVAVVPVQQARLAPLAVQLEERLLRSKQCTLVDRDKAADVLQRLDPTTLPDAPSAAQRASLCRSLSADVLVLLSKPQSQADYTVVISEATGGLRLHIARLSRSGRLERDAESIAHEVERGIEKWTSPIKHVCAIPRFNNGDHSAANEYLRAAYAQLLQAMLTQVPGVLVVEVDEARAITKKEYLAEPDVVHHTPVFMLGESKFRGFNTGRESYVSLGVHQGVSRLFSRRGEGLSPEEAASFLQRSARELIAVALKEQSAAQAIVSNDQSLARMAESHFAGGRYEQAVGCAEASLLLKPKQPTVHHLAMRAYGKCCRQQEKGVHEAVRYYDRALVHLECFLMQSHFEKPNSAVFNSISEVFYFTLFLTKNEDEEKRQAVYAHHRRARDVFIRVLTSKHKAGTLTNAQLTMILSRWLFEHDLYGESLRANLKKRLEVVPVILGNGIRYKDQFLRDLVRVGQPRHLNGTDDYSWFLDQLGDYDHPATKSIVTWAKRHRHSW